MIIRKKIVAIATCFFVAITCYTSYAKLPIDYDYFTINGKRQKIAVADILIDNVPMKKTSTGAVPITMNSRTLVPVRALSEKLGYKVTWIESAQKVIVENAGNKIELYIGNKKARVNGKSVSLPDNVSPIIANSNTYVPIRFVVENMGLDVGYDAKKNQIMLTTKTSGGDIDNLLFDNKQNVQVANNTIEKKDSVDIFSESKQTEVSQPVKPVAPTVPEKPKPTAPAKPVVEKVEPIKQEKKVETPVVKKEEPISNTIQKPTLKSALSEQNKDVFIITQNSGNIDANYFYLSSPKKLVIDIKNAKIYSEEPLQKNFENSVFKSFDSLYHEDGNYTRYAIVLSDDVNTNNLKIDIDKGVITVKKIEQKTISTNDSKAFSYSFDRATGSVKINANRQIELQNISSDTSILKLQIPKDAIKLNIGSLDISNRIVKDAQISENGNNYILEFSLSDRVVYNISNTGAKSYSIDFTKQNRQKPLIVLDAGHGGKDMGAINTQFNMTEKELNIQVVRMLKPKLEQAGYDVALTRDGDVFVPLNDIAAYSNRYDADIFISIHHNKADSPSANGIETFYYKSTQSKKLASLMQKHLIANSGAYDRKVKEMPFVVIKRTTSPATLLELGFMSNKEEIQKNMSSQYQNILTDSIVQAVNEYFGR